LKPNLLGAFAPERAVTTHPAIVEAVMMILKEENKTIWIGDSHGGTVSPKKVWSKTGLGEIAEKYDAKVLYFGESGVREFSYQDQQYHITEDIFIADACINLCKYKTHSMARFTGAVKNLYGLIPGLEKVTLHSRYTNFDAFSNFVADIYKQTKGQFVYHIMDGIIGMEGEGPSSGNPRNFGVLIHSEKASALDYQAVKMMGFDWHELTMIKQALHHDGIIPSRIVIDEQWKEFQYENVDLTAVNLRSKIMAMLPASTEKIMTKLVRYYPAFNDKCRLCKVCVKSCPENAITYTKGENTPKIDLKKCIRCMCCHEFCPYEAIYLHKSYLTKKLFGDR
ncbi:MAG: DUF362 domain-containing protein, partial [Candidatus Zophobacter franzmannii]|nr:DUF362 domain-containing protein [Candidatus Zophobacter franzmannii]